MSEPSLTECRRCNHEIPIHDLQVLLRQTPTHTPLRAPLCTTCRISVEIVSGILDDAVRLLDDIDKDPKKKWMRIRDRLMDEFAYKYDTWVVTQNDVDGRKDDWEPSSKLLRRERKSYEEEGKEVEDKFVDEKEEEKPKDPPEFKRYSLRAFSSLNKVEGISELETNRKLNEMIAEAKRNGTFYTTDWSNEMLPQEILRNERDETW